MKWLLNRIPFLRRIKDLAAELATARAALDAARSMLALERERGANQAKELIEMAAGLRVQVTHLERKVRSTESQLEQERRFVKELRTESMLKRAPNARARRNK